MANPAQARRQLASDVAAGLAGWYQLQVTQKLTSLFGEDSARLVVAQVVNAQGNYRPETSQLPPNWGNSQRRVDIALKTRSTRGTTWYGALEVKWPGESMDVEGRRLALIQDAYRLAFIETGWLNAHYLVLGASSDALKALFDAPHPRAADKEARRKTFASVFSRDLKKPEGKLSTSR